MKKSLLIALFSLAFLSAFATIWHVNNNAGVTSNFNSLDAAFSSAQVVNGDTLYVYGSSVTYGSPVNLTKRLTIIGPGYFLNQNTGLQVNLNPATIDQIILNSGSEGSLISGMVLSYCEAYSGNVVIQRNMVRRLLLHGANCMVLQNYFYEIPDYTYAMYAYGTATGMIVANNWMYYSPGNYYMSIYMEDTASGSFYNNTIYGGCRFRNAEVYNSIIGYDRPGWQWEFSFDSFCSLHHNVLLSIYSWDWTVSVPAMGTGNVYNVSDQVFVQTGSYDAYYQLCDGSPAIGAGVGGADCGMFGGATPYKLSGIPAIPTIYNFVAPATGFTIPIQIGARSNN